MGRLQTARLENFIRRWGSIKGPGSVLSETLGDVFPVLDLEHLTPENQLTAGWSLIHRFATVTGVAAQLSGVSILSPAGSGSIGVIDKIVINSELAQQVTLGTEIALFLTATNVRNRDTRSPTAFNANLQLGANANVGVAAGGIILTVAAGVDREFEIPNGLAVLAPGGQFAVVSGTVNSNLTVSFIGRTRIAEPSELSF